MSNELREELSALSWPDLKKTAIKDYGLKPHPEWTAPDYVNAIMAKLAGSTKYVTDKQALDTKDAKWGWSRIKVLRTGRESGTHCMAAHNGFQFAIPYNVEVNLPTVTAEYLTTKKSPIPKNAEDGNGTIIEYEDRWLVQFLEKNYGPEGETGYIPPKERHKYWNDTREAKLGIKRKFMEQFNYWPTDRVLREHMAAGYFTAQRRGVAA